SDDGGNVNAVRHAWNAWTQAADSAHGERNGDAGARGPVERPDHFGIDERVHLAHDGRGLALAGLLRFAIDQGDDLLVQPVRSDGEPLVAGPLGETSQEVEDLRGVIAKFRPGGEEAEVRVDFRGNSVVVACTDVYVAADGAALPAHDKSDLRVGLQS